MVKEFLVVLFLSSFVLAHLHPLSNPCDHESVMDKFYRENPGEQQRAHELALQMREAAERYLNMSSILKEASAPVTIPVVFHVLWNTARPALQLTAAQIATELNFLNQWFSATNTNYNKRSPYWINQVAVASDYKISFVLASRDPNGNPTTGINYYQTNVVNTCGSTEIFRAAEGGANAWNTLQYMNIWTCPLTNGAAGYAYLPGSGTHYRDGIVMDPQYIGPSYNSGSILAHEVGHWLGLPHIFTGTAGTCSNSDNVADTPMTDIYAWDYVSHTVCTNPNGFNDLSFQRCGGPTMFQNCMDYNWEECKAYFSKGQVAVMRTWLDTATSIRGGLRNSPGLGGGSCTPNCSGKVCGSNGCGGSCGACTSPAVCSSDGTQCVGGPSASPSPTRTPAAGASASRTPAPSPSATPTRTPQSTSSSDARNMVIQRINAVRGQVNPAPSAPLTNLGYSIPLENEARTRAQSCQFVVNPGQTGVLYNGDQTSNLSTLFSNAVGHWNTSRQFYTLTTQGSTCTAVSPNTCNFYVQMIWNNAQYPTTEVGCAAHFCSASSVTFVVCQFSGIGNQVGQLPYVPCTTPGCNPNCNSACSPGQCGIIQTECGPLNCGPCCDDPCAVNQCGTHMNSCGTAITCSSCPTGSSCTAGASGTTCVQDPVCNHDDECAAGGFECGYKVFCGVNEACGYCSAGQICSDFQCIADPCNSCGPNTNCVDGECVCQSGFVLQNGVCNVPSSGVDYTNMFAQRLPAGSVNFVIPESDLILTATGPHILDWVSSQNIVNLYTTRSRITVSMASGEFGFNIRTNQGSNRATDRVMWHVRNIGSNPSLAICLVYFGTNYCSSYSPISFPNPATVTVTMGFDGSNILTTWQVGSGSVWSSSVSQSYYPALGTISYFLSSSSNPVLSDALLATSSTLTVSLADCMDDATFAQLFYTLTGASPSTTVPSRQVGENGRCKGGESGKIVASAFTLVITSTSVPAAAIASQFAASVGSPAGAALGLASASVVSGAAGANAAGFATTIAALGGTTVVAPAVAAGGGGAAAGLSGGAIAGIVIGSVAGAVLIIGVTTIVVAAVIVAAVIVAKKASDSNDDSVQESAPSRSEARASRRIRDTIYDIFRAPKGGVDIMNNPSGHQSITARAPQA